jgi:hypothetical protein
MSPTDPSPGKAILTEALARFFGFLERRSIFELVRKQLTLKGGPRFVEIWVMSWLAVSIVGFLFSFLQLPWIVSGMIWLASAYRLYEILMYAANTVLFRSVRGATRPLRSRERYAVLILINYAEIIFWFATYYSLLKQQIFSTHDLQRDPCFTALLVLRESLVMMVANTTGAFTPESVWVLILTTLQMIIGLFMTLLVVARLINLLPIPGDPDKS